MPYIETPDELADHIADLAGVYDGCDKANEGEIAEDCRDCNCRVGFVFMLAERIRQSVKNERFSETRKHNVS